MNRFAAAALCLALLSPLAAIAAPMPGQAVLGPHDVLRGDIVQEHHSHKDATPMVTQGQFVMAQGRGLIWSVQQPLPTATILTPQGMVQSFNGVPMIRMPAASVAKLIHFYELLSAALAGDWQPLEGDFVLRRAGNAQAWQIVLIPRPDAQDPVPFQTITVTGSRFIETAVMAKANGDFERLTFAHPSVSPALSPAETAAFASVAAAGR